jgi:DNA repair protein RadC
MRMANELLQTYRNESANRLLPSPCSAMSDPELVAVWLRTGEVGKTATQIATELLKHHGGIAGLLYAAPGELASLSASRRRELCAVLELSRRALEQQLTQREVFGSPDAVKNYLQLHLARLSHEVFAILFLDAQNRLIEMNPMFRGTLTQTSVYPREVVVRALKVSASAVILAHNHPSGTVEPSRADEALTQTIKAALSLVDVRVLDHVIVAPGKALSMAEKGLL